MLKMLGTHSNYYFGFLRIAMYNPEFPLGAY